MKRVHYGKINLSLQITGKREDGYHYLDTVMQEVDVSDSLRLNKSDRTCLVCEHPSVPSDENNLILRAHRAMEKRYGECPVLYHLKKEIPVAAGMGGGSANAAAALSGLNELFGLGATREELAEIGVTLGADVPFFLYGGTCRAQGIGEVLTPLAPYRGIPVLLVNDGTAVSTQTVYRKGPVISKSRVDELLSQMEKKETTLAVQNDLEPVVFSLYPHLEKIKKEVREQGATTVLLSGSGATIFGIFEDFVSLHRAYEAFVDRYQWVCATQTR